MSPQEKQLLVELEKKHKDSKWKPITISRGVIKWIASWSGMTGLINSNKDPN